MRVFIGMETSGALRRRFTARGHHVISCDLLPAEDGVNSKSLAGEAHMRGDVFETLDKLWAWGWWPDLAIFHPDCTYLTNSAAWAFADPDYTKYPGVGYHQRVKPGTLTGAARRAAREGALDTVRKILALKIRRKAVENPVGAISKAIRPASQIIQPNKFGDDASKATCLWLDNLPKLRPTKLAKFRVPGEAPLDLLGDPIGPRRWGNQTDSGPEPPKPGR